ncbi:MAG: methyl-accepting chemotaxis protein, partial [Sporomusaceae bacterium]|nr:methyl-accepting chemotaxis protein [Sporomusaceae bacterium]
MKMMGKMLAFFLIVTTISLIGFAIVIMDSMDTKADIARVQAEEIPRFTMVAQIMENSLRQVVNIRGYAISRDPQQIENFKKLQETNRKLEEDLLKIARTEEGRKLIGDLINKQSVYSETVNREVVPAVLAGDPAVLAAAVQKAGAYSDQALAIGTDLKDRYYGAANTALAGAVASADNTINMAIIAAVVSLILSIVVAVFCSVGLSSKIRMLSVLAQKVADGDLTDSYKGSIPKDEIGDLSAALNLMVKNLKHMVITIGSQSQTLAASSEELTASADQSANAAQQVAGSVTEVAD